MNVEEAAQTVNVDRRHKGKIPPEKVALTRLYSDCDGRSNKLSDEASFLIHSLFISIITEI